ncbi:MAG: hypothetical protein WB609_06925, partial [Candidatus Cybelea sp.]
PELWMQTTVELQQELARAFEAVLAESPQFGGLFADPACRGKLTFRPVAKQLKADALRTIATRSGLLFVARRIRSNMEGSTAPDNARHSQVGRPAGNGRPASLPTSYENVGGPQTPPARS